MTVNLTPELIADLCDKAGKATPGPWHAVMEGEMLEVVDASGATHMHVLSDPYALEEEDKAFIAAANPAVVLALLDRIEALEKDVAAAQEYRARVSGLPDDAARHGGLSEWKR